MLIPQQGYETIEEYMEEDFIAKIRQKEEETKKVLQEAILNKEKEIQALLQLSEKEIITATEKIKKEAEEYYTKELQKIYSEIESLERQKMDEINRIRLVGESNIAKGVEFIIRYFKEKFVK